jgi:hypothetical protein
MTSIREAKQVPLIAASDASIELDQFRLHLSNTPILYRFLLNRKLLTRRSIHLVLKKMQVDCRRATK